MYRAFKSKFTENLFRSYSRFNTKEKSDGYDLNIENQTKINLSNTFVDNSFNIKSNNFNSLISKENSINNNTVTIDIDNDDKNN